MGAGGGSSWETRDVYRGAAAPNRTAVNRVEGTNDAELPAYGACWPRQRAGRLTHELDDRFGINNNTAYAHSAFSNLQPRSTSFGYISPHSEHHQSARLSGRPTKVCLGSQYRVVRNIMYYNVCPDPFAGQLRPSAS